MNGSQPESARAIYIASSEGGTGKSSVALGVLAHLTATGGRVGVFRPISRAGAGERDYILDLLMEHTSVDIPYEECLGVTYDDVHADPEQAISDIVARFHVVAQQCDNVLVIGSDYTDVASPSELSFNARIAANLAAPVLLVASAAGRTPTDMHSMVELLIADIEASHAEMAGVVANRCEPDQVQAVADAISDLGCLVWAVPEEPILNAPTMAELAEALDATLYSGDADLLDREALDVMVGGMTVEHILERLEESMAVIAPADRSDVLLSLVNANAAQGFPRLSGIILNGGLNPHPMIDALVKGLRPTLPILQCQYGTYETARIAATTRGRMVSGSARKVEAALALMDRHVGFEDLFAETNVHRPEVVTPQMFEYQLIAQAKSDPQHIVLPEGDDDRILRAAGRLLRRGVARLTVLGDEDKVRDRAKELGVDLTGIDVIDNRTSDLLEGFAHSYYELRKHKGMTEERALEVVRDESYFGTMMLHTGMVDGMVSGAVHTTAQTIRPAFEIIKTQPGVKTVSSVFFMCLADKVLTYGDCAVVPDPSAEELADIAISSAGTASAFGIDPRVAMLSYSTGGSGSGADVDKVRQATELVRERAPQILVEGPIQYDAAIDPSVAATKMPDSPVAGRATVLIFPDLNTGNNTYKAVQRSASAIAIGPVLQGLNKPMNDLSRGALISDIVNTVAITAIQAQNIKAAALSSVTPPRAETTPKKARSAKKDSAT
ncbi:MAG: phosphate acetyltransferase [Gordonia sp. (in: high G+C Gram-positive bacteria)]|uniref:phosphate acetyltransferase n=1 Tax=Gordonia sp. (in: high G+C Gram-positive bacteria) TaxID=84139 RepID=UPI0039E297C3